MSTTSSSLVPCWPIEWPSVAVNVGINYLRTALTLLSGSPLVVLCRDFGLLGALRRIVWRAFNFVYCRLDLPRFVHAKLTQGDPAYDWLIQYLVQEKLWPQSTLYKLSTISMPNRWLATGIVHQNPNDMKRTSLSFMPAWDKPKVFRWKNHWFEIASEVAHYSNPDALGPMKKITTVNSLILTAYTFNMDVLTDFIEHVQDNYLKLRRSHVLVHLPAPGIGPLGWGPIKRKPRRPLDTLILPEGAVEDLLADTREFLASEEWYNDAGVPHRRGYLLHGPPGTGKTTTIYSIAGELGLEIYSLSLSSNSVTDASLQTIVSAIPKGGILLIEDIDVAFPNREDIPEETTRTSQRSSLLSTPVRSSVTLSGLLNVLDGVASDEGRLFFATTNYIDRLDSAFLRPGRIDKQVEYRLTAPQQAENLFIRWYSAKRTTQPSSSVEESDEIRHLAKEFALLLPPEELSPAQIQGYLLGYKRDPILAVEHVREWLERERELKAEKEERERQRRQKLAEMASKAKVAKDIPSFA